MNIRIIPYCTVDGLWTFKDSQVAAFFRQMEEDGTVETVFYDGQITTAAEFIAYMKSSQNFLYIALVDGVPAGIAWLNGYEGKSARSHFCSFSQFWGNTSEIGKAMLQFLIHIKDRSGIYLFDVIIGRVPEWNILAINALLNAGCKRLSKTIPNACWNAKKQKSESAVIIHYTREEVPDENL